MYFVANFFFQLTFPRKKKYIYIYKIYIIFFFYFREGKISYITEILHEIGINNAKSTPILSGVINHTHFLSVGRVFILSFMTVFYRSVPTVQGEGVWFSYDAVLHCYLFVSYWQDANRGGVSLMT